MSEFNDDELAFLYLLNELDPEDRERVETRLEHRDPNLLAAFEAAERTASSLPNSLPPVPLRPELKRELMARVDRTPKMRARHGEAIAPVQAIPIAPRIGADARAYSVDWKIAALLLLGFGIASFTSLSLWRDRDRIVAEQLAQDAGRAERAIRDVGDELEAARIQTRGLLAELNQSEQARSDAEEELARARETLAQLSQAPTPEIAPSVDSPATIRLREALARQESERVAMQERLVAQAEEASARSAELARQQARLMESTQALELVSAPDVGIVDLFSPQEGAASSASVYWDRGLTHCYFQARALPDLSADERYATWLRYENGNVVRVADFEVDRRGDATFFAPLPKGNGEVAATFVTRESVAGAEQPSKRIVLEEIIATGEATEGDSNSRRRYRRRNT